MLDHWIPGHILNRDLNPFQHASLVHQYMKVCDLITEGNWNLPTPYNNAIARIWESIKQIQLPPELTPDDVIWQQATDGAYLVRERYLEL